MSKRSAFQWFDFLITPLPMPGGGIDVHSLADYEQTHVRTLFKSALVREVLHSSILLAQFVHVIPEHLKIKFEMTTAVRSERAEEVVSAIALHGGFVRRSRISFFKNAIYKLNGRGLICSISRRPQSVLSLDYAEHLPVHLEVADGREDLFPRLNCNGLDTEVIEDTDYSFVSEKEVEELIRVASETLAQGGTGNGPVTIKSPPKVIRRMDEIIGDRLNEYLTHTLPLSSHGDVILCVPLLYSFDENGHLGQSLGGGGCVFLVRDGVDKVTLRRLYLFTYKLCSMVSGIIDVAQVSSRKEAEEIGTAITRQMALLLQHEYNNTSAQVQSTLRRIEKGLPKTSRRKAAAAQFQDVYMILNLMSISIEGLNSLFDLGSTQPLADIVNDIRKVTLNSTEFPLKVTWAGDGGDLKTFEVPRAYRVVLAELLRNALKEVQDLTAGASRETLLEVTVKDGTASVTVENTVDKSEDEIRKKMAHLDAYTPDRNGLLFGSQKLKHLGLILCKDIVKRSGGALKFDVGGGKFRATVSYSGAEEDTYA